MGAIAVSKKEEQQIERLRKELRIPTKAGVLRAALKTPSNTRLQRSGYGMRSRNPCGVARTSTNENIESFLRLPWAAGFRKRRCR